MKDHHSEDKGSSSTRQPGKGGWREQTQLCPRIIPMDDGVTRTHSMAASLYFHSHLLPQPAPCPRERHTREPRAGEGKHPPLSAFFPRVAQFPGGIHCAKCAGSSEAPQNTAMATKSGKGPESHEGTASLGWGRIRLILKEKTTALGNFSLPQTSIYEELLK